MERERLLAGAIRGAFEAWLVLRSLGSAGLRIERQCANAQALATMLHGHPAVRAVRYPGLVDDPAYPVAAAQMRRFGALVSIELADADAVHALVQRSELLTATTSFGGIHTSVDRRARWGDPVADGFARISLGIEDTDDLLTDIHDIGIAGNLYTCTAELCTETEDIVEDENEREAFGSHAGKMFCVEGADHAAEDHVDCCGDKRWRAENEHFL